MKDAAHYLDQWTQLNDEAQRILAEIVDDEGRQSSVGERVAMARAYATLAAASAIAATATSE